MSDKNTVNVVLSTDAKRRLDGIVDSFDMKQKAALGRILGWFTEQDRMVQSLVLGHITAEYAGDIIDLMYARRLAERGTVDINGPDSPAAIVRRAEQRAEAHRREQTQKQRQTRRKRA